MTTEAPVMIKMPLGARPQCALFDMKEFTKEPDRIQKAIITRNKNFEARNERIRTRFNELYNEKRKRIDDVIEELCKEFCVEKITIDRALKS